MLRSFVPRAMEKPSSICPGCLTTSKRTTAIDGTGAR